MEGSIGKRWFSSNGTGSLLYVSISLKFLHQCQQQQHLVDLLFQSRIENNEMCVGSSSDISTSNFFPCSSICLIKLLGRIIKVVLTVFNFPRNHELLEMKTYSTNL